MAREKMTPEEARSSGALLVDIRKNPDDRQIPGSIRLEGAALEAGGAAIPFDKDREVVLYCGSGNSCSRIAGVLRERGYNTAALDGGYKSWVESGLPTEPR
jgi:rhodanese-related sulfurtransferase